MSGYADGGDAPEKELQLVPGATDEAEAFLKRSMRKPHQRLTNHLF